jgi:hypothetical protein
VVPKYLKIPHCTCGVWNQEDCSEFHHENGQIGCTDDFENDDGNKDDGELEFGCGSQWIYHIEPVSQNTVYEEGQEEYHAKIRQ